MRMKPFEQDDGYRVWLNDDEVSMLLDTLEDRGGTPHITAGRLGVHCGLRREEASEVSAVDVTEDLGETNLRVWEDAAKRDKYRETPIPQDLADRIRMIPEYDDTIGIDDPVLDCVPKTLNRWVQRAAEELYADTGDEGWLELSFHDLRRTWGTRLLEQGVLPSVVMLYGGWDDWETFRKHYLGEFSPHALRRERGKVSWLGGGDEQMDVEDHVTRSHNPRRRVRVNIGRDRE